MCLPAFGAALAGLGAGGAATAAGATAGAATGSLASGLATIGSALSIVGPLVQGIQANRAARENVRLINEQREQEASLNATRANRELQQWRRAMSQQRVDLAERGIALDSPTAVFLGQTAAREMSFNDQAIRSGGQARDAELSAEARIWRSRGTQALFRGGLSAAGAFLNRPTDEWAELLA
ncbi:hypothetical protein [Pseudooceanicola sp.]|uniref:hypothetical protein n=1 Tax=Pseudooceanicola sp. TaxID=1914328 RepID=UPI00405A0E49